MNILHRILVSYISSCIFLSILLNIQKQKTKTGWIQFIPCFLLGARLRSFCHSLYSWYDFWFLLIVCVFVVLYLLLCHAFFYLSRMFIRILFSCPQWRNVIILFHTKLLLLLCRDVILLVVDSQLMKTFQPKKRLKINLFSFFIVAEPKYCCLFFLFLYR